MSVATHTMCFGERCYFADPYWDPDEVQISSGHGFLRADHKSGWFFWAAA